eukprot:tig00000158_g10175.t1
MGATSSMTAQQRSAAIIVYLLEARKHPARPFSPHSDSPFPTSSPFGSVVITGPAFWRRSLADEDDDVEGPIPDVRLVRETHIRRILNELQEFRAVSSMMQSILGDLRGQMAAAARTESQEEIENRERHRAAAASITSQAYTLTENHPDACSICLDPLSKGCEVNSLPCSHIFHRNCISQWLPDHPECPVCRALAYQP